MDEKLRARDPNPYYSPENGGGFVLKSYLVESQRVASELILL